MSKSAKVVAGIIIVIVIAGVGFALFHKSGKNTPAVSSNTNSSSQSNNAPAVNNAVLTTKTDSSLGQYLADTNGKPLYTYNADSNGKSNCTGTCLANWPAYQATGSTTNLPSGVSVITRADNGQKQYTYNGMPLYYFTADTNGKPTGNGVENFSIARPAAASSSSTSSSTNSTSTQSNTSTSSGYPY